MTRTVRWTIALATGFVGLLIAAVFILTAVVDPNSYRDEIESAVRQATARDFRLQGDIDIAWFPWLALETGPAELGNPDGFSPGPPLLKWRSASVGVRALPLLRRSLVVDRVRFDGLWAHLRVDADGRANWEGFATPRPEEGGGAGPIPRNAGLEIRDGSLEYSDARSGARVGIAEWHLDVGAFSSGEPVPVQTRFSFRGLPVELREDALTVSLDPLRISAPAWSLRLGDASIEGALASEDGLQRIGGSVRGAAPSLRALLASLGANAPQTRDAEAIGALRLAGSWRYDRGMLTVKPLELKLDDTTLSGTLSRAPAARADAEALWMFELRGDRVDLDRYRKPDEAGGKPFELPVEQLQAANVRGTLTFEHARLAGIDANDVNLRVVTDEPAQ
ncbi:MAG: AsmA family protein [Gammaproteobacteria bacterium]